MSTNRVRSLLKSLRSWVRHIKVQLSIPFRWAVLSSISMRFYLEVLELRSRTILKYLVVVLIFLASLQTINPIMFLAELNFKTIGQGIQETYPEDLVLVLEEGRLEINQPTPYAVHASLPNTPTGFSLYPLVIFASNEYISEFRVRETLRPMVFLTESHMLWITKTDYHAVQYPADLPRVEITSEHASNLRHFLENSLIFRSGILFPIAWVLVFLWEFFVGSIGYLAWALLTSVIGWILSEWYTGTRLGYSTSLKVAVFALSLPLLIQILLGVFRLPTLPWQLLYLVYLIWHTRVLIWVSRQLSRQVSRNTRGT